MSSCNNCFTPIAKRSEGTSCDECGVPIHVACAIKEDGTYCDNCFVVKTENPPEQTFSFELPEVIRRTYIETYRSCPYKFLREAVEGHEQGPTSYTQVGVDLHDLFEEALWGRIGKVQMREQFKTIWDAYPDELWESNLSNKSDAEHKEEMYQRSFTSMENFWHIQARLPQPWVTEEKIIFSVGDELPKVSITMDLITENGEELDMHDWKTGKVMVGQKLSSDLQAPLYIYAVQQHFKRPVRSFTFYYVNEGKERTFVRTMNPDIYECTVNKRVYRISIQDAIREVQSVFSHIVKGNFNIPRDTKKMHFTCKACHLQKKGLCEGAELQSWHNKSW